MSTGDGRFRQTIEELNAIVTDRKPAIPSETRQHPTHRFLALSRDARVWRYSSQFDRWKEIKRGQCREGHAAWIKVKIGGEGGRPISFSLAGLVLQAWVGPRPLGYEPLHFPDRSPHNCHLDNLRWAPRGTHLLGHGRGDVARFGKVYRGSETRNHILEESDIPEIRELYRQGFHCDEIGERFFVSVWTISSVIRGRTWAHVEDPLGPILGRRNEISSID